MNNIDTPSQAEDAGEYKQDLKTEMELETRAELYADDQVKNIQTAFIEVSKEQIWGNFKSAYITGQNQARATPLPVQALNERAEAYASKGKPEGLSHTSALANAIVDSLKEAYIAGATESLSVPVDVVEKLEKLNPYLTGEKVGDVYRYEGFQGCCQLIKGIKEGKITQELNKLLTQNNQQQTT